mmetsp:Transcript_9267/g.28639  ORF Transcript_9267/g.28639 Transcript_9267/m.28639 type:complete len:200 (-) Transcript_9267:152-751(-)
MLAARALRLVCVLSVLRFVVALLVVEAELLLLLLGGQHLLVAVLGDGPIDGHRAATDLDPVQLLDSGGGVIQHRVLHKGVAAHVAVRLARQGDLAQRTHRLELLADGLLVDAERHVAYDQTTAALLGGTRDRSPGHTIPETLARARGALLVLVHHRPAAEGSGGPLLILLVVQALKALQLAVLAHLLANAALGLRRRPV